MKSWIFTDQKTVVDLAKGEFFTPRVDTGLLSQMKSTLPFSYLHSQVLWLEEKITHDFDALLEGSPMYLWAEVVDPGADHQERKADQSQTKEYCDYHTSRISSAP